MHNIAKFEGTDTNLTPEKIRERDRKYVCHPWSPMSEDRSKHTFERGDGYKVWDIDGKEYIDCCSLNSTCGYGNHDIATPAYQQLIKFHGTDLSLASHPPVGELAERIASFLPNELSKTLFVNSGSEGIEAAVFIAASYWEQIGQPRHRLISFADGYHGSTIATRTITQLPRVVQPFDHPITSTYVELPAKPKDLHKPENLQPLLDAFEKALKDDDTPPMAVVVEPLLNVGGGIKLPKGFLAGLRKLCNDTGALLILDEVFTAYARTGKMFAFQHEDMHPDILVSSKGLAGGYMPITAVTMTKDIHTTFSKDIHIGGLRYGHTTSGHAVACIAALATLDLIERESLCERADKFGNKLVEEFSQYKGQGDIVDVRGMGLIFILELPTYEIGAKFKEVAESKGLLVRQSGPAIKVVPPLTIDEDGINKVIHILKDCLQEGGFI